MAISLEMSNRRVFSPLPGSAAPGCSPIARRDSPARAAGAGAGPRQLRGGWRRVSAVLLARPAWRESSGEFITRTMSMLSFVGAVAPRLAGPAPRVASRPARGLSIATRPVGPVVVRAAAGPGNPRGKKMKKVKAKKRNKMRQVRSGNESPAVLPTSSFRRPATTRSPIDDVPPLASRVARRRRESQPPTPRR